MKKSAWLIALFTGVTAAAAAQDMEGMIVYQVKLNTDSLSASGAPGHAMAFRSRGGHRPGPPGGAMAGNPAPRMALYFRGEESLYKPHEEEDDEDYRFSGGGRTIRMGQLHHETYMNTGTREQVKSVELGRRYLIESSIKEIPWKLSEDTATILGYLCKSARYHNMETGRDVTAWYTEELRVPAGPAAFHSLPGMILRLDMDRMNIRALSVDLRPLEDRELERPKKGKKVTEEEFEEIREEKIKRMRERAGGMPGRPVIMR